MNFSDLYISSNIKAYFQSNRILEYSLSEINNVLLDDFGIVDFFGEYAEIEAFQEKINCTHHQVKEVSRRAYGDFQTNSNLASRVAIFLLRQQSFPTFLLEPTCGKGAFIIAALENFDSLQKIVGIEIYLPHIWQAKFNVLDCHLQGKAKCKPIIQFYHENIFVFNLERLAVEQQRQQVLILGNPPWVTNAELGTLEINNLPKKSNFKKQKGIDAITGKGNFDIGEYITWQLLKSFHQCDVTIAFLVKNTVVKNVLMQQKKTKLYVGNLQQLDINAKKEFGAAVEACLFYANLNQTPALVCKKLDFYSQKMITTFGWGDDKFVYNIEAYQQFKEMDGTSPFVWRQGIKHDCSKVMELERKNGHFINGLKKEISLEQDLLYGLLKSSDLKEAVVNNHRKTTIVTQKKIGQNTQYIQDYFPKTYAYLKEYQHLFEKRKSSIYENKPAFSIFGVGDYSFAPYKVAISGMYNRTTFSLVMPYKNKAVMLDDTCYFIGFDDLEKAQLTQRILNSEAVQLFLKSIIFPSAKRPITKEVLMRIDILKAINFMEKDSFNKVDLENYVHEMNRRTTQMTLF